MIVIKNSTVYAPDNIGKKDILIAGEKIEYIADSITVDVPTVTIIDGSDLLTIPGIIDGHVHITGGGGEGGVTTRTPPLKCSELIKNGITTVLGLLGTDGTTRTHRDLIAKAQSFNELGLTAFALSGSYEYPLKTLTGNIRDDIVFVREILGSKIALSDHRSSGLTVQELIKLASDVYVGGKLSGKKGILTAHIGDGRQGLGLIKQALELSDLPHSVFHPTHINRNDRLLEESIEFLHAGGYGDLTTGETGRNRPGDVIKRLLESGINTERLTLSSDGNGSFSTYDKDGELLEIGAASVSALIEELRYMVRSLNIPLETALPFFTVNPANALGLGLSKGVIKSGYDADILITDKNLCIDYVIARGKLLLEHNEITRMIPFE